MKKGIKITNCGYSYTLVKEIDQGSVGVVWKATRDPLSPEQNQEFLDAISDRKLWLKTRFADHEIAVKFFKPPAELYTRLFPRFIREAQAQKEIHDPNIIRVYDLNESPADDLQPYYTMELAETNLEKIIDNSTPSTRPSQHRCLQIIMDICSGLEHAYRNEIKAHGDLHPANILIGEEGRAKISDFGMILLEKEDLEIYQMAATHLEPQTIAKGTNILSPYVAPEIREQGRNAATQMSDVYSLGMILRYMLPNREKPYDESLVEIVSKAVNPYPHMRYATVNEFARAIIDRDLKKPQTAPKPAQVQIMTTKPKPKPEPERIYTPKPSGLERTKMRIEDAFYPLTRGIRRNKGKVILGAIALLAASRLAYVQLDENTQVLERIGAAITSTDHCGDGVDNDKDGRTDDGDADCLERNPATGKVEYNKERIEKDDKDRLGTCADYKDNDGDGLRDGEDPDCRIKRYGPKAEMLFLNFVDEKSRDLRGFCENGRDEDDDGLVDMQDPDCYGHKPEELCDAKGYLPHNLESQENKEGCEQERPYHSSAPNREIPAAPEAQNNGGTEAKAKKKAFDKYQYYRHARPLPADHKKDEIDRRVERARAANARDFNTSEKSDDSSAEEQP